MGRTAHGDLFARPTSQDRMVAAAMLDRLGIAQLAQRPYTMISGGERQLVLLARALAQEPQFIVLDEPTANLDFGNQGKVMREIRALAGSGLGVLFTTHDPSHALRAADRAYLLRDGQRLAEGPVKQILTRERLEALYGAPVHMITDRPAPAFIPGEAEALVDQLRCHSGASAASNPDLEMHIGFASEVPRGRPE